MNRRTVFMFSGQGSQYFQMGRLLFEKNAVFRNSMVQLDVMARELSGSSVLEVLYAVENNITAKFDRTLLTSPAIFMVEYSLAKALIRSGVVPDKVIGVSLGSFAAACVAGFMPVEAALTAVIRQAEMLEACCESGVMAAILADPALFSEDALAQHSELAAVNFSSHFVISTHQTKWKDIESYLRTRGAGFQRLPVSFAFHSQWIDRAQGPFESFMQSMVFKENTLPFMCSVRPGELVRLRAAYFWDAVRQPIRFREAIAQLENTGAHNYVDVGPASTLATFLKYDLPKTSTSAIHSVLTPYGNDVKNMAALTANLL